MQLVMSHVKLSTDLTWFTGKDREPYSLDSRVYGIYTHIYIYIFRYVYPDFLPNPDWRKRDRISEKLERLDMYRRRSNIEIPEFYVGKSYRMFSRIFN